MGRLANVPFFTSDFGSHSGNPTSSYADGPEGFNIEGALLYVDRTLLWSFCVDAAHHDTTILLPCRTITRGSC